MTDFPTVVPARDAARVVGLSESTLAKLRVSGNGPTYCKLGRRVLYRPDDLTNWLAQHRRRSTSEMGEVMIPVAEAHYLVQEGCSYA